MGERFVVNAEGRIQAATGSAENLVGAPGGRFCWDVVGALDPERRPICTPGCVQKLLDDGTEVEHGQVQIRGEGRRLTCMAVGDNAVVSLTACRSNGLSMRERQVLELVAHGLSSKQIGAELGIGGGTVRCHVERARKKLGAHTRAEAVALGLREGAIKGPR